MRENSVENTSAAARRHTVALIPKPVSLDESRIARVAKTAGTNSETVLLFQEALCRLSLSPKEQITTKQPDVCLACDLVNDYEDASLTHVALRLPFPQKSRWKEIGELFEEMDEIDLACVNDNVVHRPAWGKVRAIAGELLRQFVAMAVDGAVEWTAGPTDLVAEYRRVLGAKTTDTESGNRPARAKIEPLLNQPLQM